MTRRVRCEVTGCRGNAPCEACLLELSEAIRRGILASMPPEATKSRVKVVCDGIFANVKVALDQVWAKTVTGGRRN